MSERDQFEAWWEEWFGEAPMSGWDNLRTDSGYSAEEIDIQWEAWMGRASREALKAEQGYPDKLPCPVILEPGLRFGKGVPTRTMLGALQRRAEYYAELEAMTPEQRAKQHEDLRNFLNLNPIDTTPNQYDALGKGGEQ